MTSVIKVVKQHCWALDSQTVKKTKEKSKVFISSFFAFLLQSLKVFTRDFMFPVLHWLWSLTLKDNCSICARLNFFAMGRNFMALAFLFIYFIRNLRKSAACFHEVKLQVKACDDFIFGRKRRYQNPNMT
jgi:hypothetical protein